MDKTYLFCPTKGNFQNETLFSRKHDLIPNFIRNKHLTNAELKSSPKFQCFTQNLHNLLDLLLFTL